jgi:Flp pilus assembly protein TadG
MLSRLYRFLVCFRRDDGGAVALIFGLALLPLMGMTGASIDYSRASTARHKATAAADAAALATVKAKGTFEQRRQIGESTLRANMPMPDPDMDYTFVITQIMKDNAEIGVKVTVSGHIKAAITGLIGVPMLGFAAHAEATTGALELTDVVFVLDTTDSMQGNRLATLKSSTTSVLADFEARRGNPQQIRVAVVPFAQYVNIGMSRRKENWLDVSDDYQTPVVDKCSDVLETRKINCRKVTIPAVLADPNRMCTVDGVQRPCPRAAVPARQTEQCDTVRGPNIVKQCSRSGGQWFRWTGCVGSRNAPNHTIDGNYAERIPGLMNTTCGSPVLDWTDNLASARTMIGGLATAGETYLPSGLIWGWRMLSTQVPFSGRSATAALPVKRYMILVTDGQNTKSASFPKHDGTSTAVANATTLAICQNMAADKGSAIKLHTIAFEVSNPAVKELLKQCSTLNGGEFFDAANAAQLQAALKDIGSQMTQMRLTK